MHPLAQWNDERVNKFRFHLRMICTDKAVVHTNQFTLFNNMLEWRTFRKRVRSPFILPCEQCPLIWVHQVLSKLGLHQEASRLDAPPKVVFKSTGRAVNNMKGKRITDEESKHFSDCPGWLRRALGGMSQVHDMRDDK